MRLSHQLKLKYKLALLFAGTVLFSFESSGSSSIELVPHEDRFKDYLLLETTGPNRYQISLTKSIDLNILNPRPPPVIFMNREFSFCYIFLFCMNIISPRVTFMKPANEVALM